MDNQLTKISRFLSLVLRHEPGKIGISLDDAGWVDVDVLLAACDAHGRALSREVLELIVRENDKQRFAFSEDGRRIRANQGHSVAVDLGYVAVAPPEYLYHGTPKKFVASIRQKGILKGERHHVHLSKDKGTAETVGARRGSAEILTIRAGAMHRAGIKFFQSANGVWLTDYVSPEYIE